MFDKGAIRLVTDYKRQFEVGLKRISGPPRNYSYLLTKNNALLQPTRIYALLNTRCNERCLMCGHWRNVNTDEMTTEEWIQTLGGLRDFIGSFHINFSGGEPFMRKDIFDIFEFLTKMKCLVGVCTNGALITDEGARRLCELELFNYNTSLDGSTPETHNYLRGRKNAYKWVFRGISRIREAGKTVGYTPAIVVKPTVCKKNMRELVDIVRMTRDNGWAAVNFQPMGIWTEETKPGGELWIGPEDIDEFEEIVEQLVEMRNQGYPIWTSSEGLKKMVFHFKKTYPKDRRSWCSVGMTNITIHANGDVKFCDKFPAAGNAKDSSIKEIWYSEKGERIRKKVTRCTKLCLENCRIERSIRDQLAIFNIIRKGRKLKAARP